MANIIRVKWKYFLQPDSSNVKQATVKIKISEVEDRPISKSADVIGDDQGAVMLLHLLIVGDRVIPKGRNKDDEGDKQDAYGKIIRIDAY